MAKMVDVSKKTKDFFFSLAPVPFSHILYPVQDIYTSYIGTMNYDNDYKFVIYYPDLIILLSAYLENSAI